MGAFKDVNRSISGLSVRRGLDRPAMYKQLPVWVVCTLHFEIRFTQFRAEESSCWRVIKPDSDEFLLSMSTYKTVTVILPYRSCVVQYHGNPGRLPKY